jgi:hypothetical protein
MLSWCSSCYLSCLPHQLSAAFSRLGLMSCHHHCCLQPLFIIPLHLGLSWWQGCPQENARNPMLLMIVVPRYGCLTRTSRQVSLLLIVIAFVDAAVFVIDNTVFSILLITTVTIMAAATIWLTHNPAATAAAVAVRASYLHC